MRSGGILVHSSFPNLPLGCPIVHELLNFRDALHDAARQVLDIDATTIRVFFQLKLVINVLLGGQEVSDILIVNLEV